MTPVRRPSELWIPSLLVEYRRLAKLPRVVSFELFGDGFRARRLAESPIWQYHKNGQDYAGLVAALTWIRNGPKIVDVTEEQFQALSRVEVRLETRDFRMPYPALLVNMPPGRVHRCVILTMSEVSTSSDPIPILIGASISHDNTSDIVTVVRQKDGEVVESYLGSFHGNVTAEEAEATYAAMRVACNMALAMANYGCQAQYLFPREVEQERKFVLKGDRQGRSGQTASERLAEAPMLVTLNREVKLYHREGSHEAGQPTGREMPFHWRRGHWAKLACGKGRSERKLVFRPPVMVRADLLVADKSETTTTYK